MKLKVISNVLLAILFLSTSMIVKAGNPEAGNPLYQEKCAMCHGSNGLSVLPGAPNFIKGERMQKPDNLLMKSVKNGLNAMPPYRGMLSDSQLSDILAYIRKLKK